MPSIWCWHLFFVDAPPITGDSFGVVDVIGFGAFAFGFIFEVVADAQKSAFRAEPENKDKFITSGRSLDTCAMTG